MKIINDGSPWLPIVAKEDVFKTDRVKSALRLVDIAAAAKEANLFVMMPLAGGGKVTKISSDCFWTTLIRLEVIQLRT